jgi:hypothetical protein
MDFTKTGIANGEATSSAKAGEEAGKAKAFLQALVKFGQDPQVQNIATLGAKVTKANYDLTKVARLTPKNAAVVITSQTLVKAMAVAGFTTTGDAKKCMESVANLGADFALAAGLGATSLGVGAILPLALAAIDAYNVGTYCFEQDGASAHAISSDARKVIKQGLKTSKHGPI